MNDRFRFITSGVLLGVAGTALLELLKTVIAAVFGSLSRPEADAYSAIVFTLAVVVALLLAALATGASASQFAYYALPLVLLAIAATLVGLLVATYAGLFGHYEVRDLRPLGSALAMLGASLLLLGAARTVRRDYEQLAIAITRPLRPLVAHVTARFSAVLLLVGGILLTVGILVSH